jgi:inner membrane protein
MDSLTQLTLGAAVGEATLGRKIGNRAMLWGAVAGTIPDLDVFAGLMVNMTSLETLTFHRGPSHSISFAVIFPVLLATYTHWLYRNGHHKKRRFKIAGFTAGLLFIGFVLFILWGMLNEFFGLTVSIIGSAFTLGASLYIAWRMWKYYLMRESDDLDISWKQWYLLFFLATVTHPILDSFTVFGTLLFWPFSDLRVAWSNISVADPLYTFPFVFFLVCAAFSLKGSKRRWRLNTAGLMVSSLYMLFTMFNQQRMYNILKDNLAEKGIEYNRILTSPTILNNVLWHNVVETDSVYYQGLYSFFDGTRNIDLIPVPANHHLVADNEDDHTLDRLRWFSDDFYAIMERRDGRLQFNDMRYGTFRGNAGTEDDYIFYFILNETEDGSFEMEETDPGPPEGEGEKLMAELWARIWGDVDAGED